MLILSLTSYLDAFSNYLNMLSYLTMHLIIQLIHHWHTIIGPLVLDYISLNILTFVKDRNQPVLRRF